MVNAVRFLVELLSGVLLLRLNNSDICRWFRGTLIRHFLFEPLPVCLLPCGVLDPSRKRFLILLLSPPDRFTPPLG